MTEKELKKSILGGASVSNLLLTFKIIFDLLPQFFLVYFVYQSIQKQMSGEKLYFIFLLVFLSFLLKELTHYFATKLAHDKAYQKLKEIRVKMIHHLKKLNLGFFQEHSTGELTNIMQHDIEQVEVYLAHGRPEIMSATLLPLLIFIVMLFIDYRLALVMIFGLPLMFLVKILSQKIMTKNFQLYFEHENKMREELMEYVKNIAVIKAFSKEEDMSHRTLKTAREYVYWIKKSMAAVSIPFGLLDIFMEMGVILVMIFGLFFLTKQEISVPKFILSIILSSAFTSAISKTATLQHFSIVFQEALKSIGKVLLVPIVETKKEENLEFGDIVFDKVSFQYARDGFSLENISFCLKENTLNAFVGSSGCGKTTISQLLMGFWEINSGSIQIHGKNIKNYSQKALASLIGSVQQEVILFNLSIVSCKIKCHTFIK